MLIGFHGKMRRGKDTACQFVLDAYQGARREGFADRLKVSAARALGFRGNVAESIEFCNELKQNGITIEVWDDNPGHPYKLKSLSGRQYLQWYGTEAHRDVFDQDFWVNVVLDGYNPLGDDFMVISDVRFDNEAEAIQAYGGTIVHVVRPDLDAAEEGHAGHASEQVLPPELIDHTIVNDGTLEDLRGKVLEYVEQLSLVA